jgi:predicted anti-sigma-YlaC factor YlaD
MKCSEVQKKLIFYIEKELGNTSTNEIESHLKECKKCNLLYNEMSKTLGILDNMEQLKPNPFFYTRLNEKIKDIDNKESGILFSPSFIKILQPIAISLVLVVSLVLGIIIGNEFSKNSYFSDNSIESNLQIYSDNFYLNEIDEESFENFLITGKNE